MYAKFKDLVVAPHVGAWIEIADTGVKTLNAESHPTWVRGLKLPTTITKTTRYEVAPHVGAWIEMKIIF